MGGVWMAAGANNPGAQRVKVSGTNRICVTWGFDGLTKAVRLLLTDTPQGIAAQATWARWWPGDARSLDLDVAPGFTEVPIATTDGMGGYGCRGLILAF